MNKNFTTVSIHKRTAKRIDELTEETRLNRSSIIDIATELMLREVRKGKTIFPKTVNDRGRPRKAEGEAPSE